MEHYYSSFLISLNLIIYLPTQQVMHSSSQLQKLSPYHKQIARLKNTQKSVIC